MGKMEETLTCDEFDDKGTSGVKNDKMEDGEETKELACL